MGETQNKRPEVKTSEVVDWNSLKTTARHPVDKAPVVKRSHQAREQRAKTHGGNQ